MAKIRINKYLAQLGVGSRRAVDVLLADGKVQVDGQIATLGMQLEEADLANLNIFVKNKKVIASPSKLEKKYFIVYKPRGMVTTTNDELGRKNILSLIPGQKLRLFPVGRLDKDSEGLLILTNDGELTHHLTHPKFGVDKVYQVWVSGEWHEGKAALFARGFRLDGIPTGTIKAEATHLRPREYMLRLTIHEGRYHFIRRICTRVQLEILRLCRVQYGPISLGHLKPGEYRELTEAEQQLLIKKIKL